MSALAAGALRVCIARQPGGEGLPLPTQATPGSAGFDLAAAVETECVVKPGERVLVPTGFAIAVPKGYEAQIRPRSGLALRHGIVLPNAPGTIDSDYRGELKVIAVINEPRVIDRIVTHIEAGGGDDPFEPRGPPPEPSSADPASVH